LIKMLWLVIDAKELIVLLLLHQHHPPQQEEQIQEFGFV